MKKKIISTIAVIAAISGIFITSSKPVFADPSQYDVCSNPSISSTVKDAAGCNDTDQPQIESVIGNIVSAIIGILGIVAVVFIVIGGVQYMTSAGDSGKTKKAKDTILYACIGLAVAALAFAITQFAINAINNSH